MTGRVITFINMYHSKFLQNVPPSCARNRHLERRLPGSGLERGPGCHPERSEGSLPPSSQTLRGVSPERSAWAQGDRHALQMSIPGMMFSMEFIPVGAIYPPALTAGEA